MKLLIVDDSEENRMLVRAYLKGSGHDVDEAENGQIAVEKAKSNKYDVVFMDVQMPVMDGYTAIRQLREWESAQNKPRLYIITLTAHVLKDEEDKSKKAGSDLFLTKPVRKNTILEILNKINLS